MNLILDLSAPILCILCVLCSIVGLYFWKKCEWPVRYWIIPFSVLYAWMLIKLTLFPVYIYDRETLEAIKEGAGDYFVFCQWIPFASIRNYLAPGAKVQLVGNLFLLAPLAVFIEVFTMQRLKPCKAILLGSSVSFGIELLQLVTNLATGFPARVTDVDDLILNISGIICTVVLLRCIRKYKSVYKGIENILYR